MVVLIIQTSQRELFSYKSNIYADKYDKYMLNTQL